jgi:hypothetical protein
VLQFSVTAGTNLLIDLVLDFTDYRPHGIACIHLSERFASDFVVHAGIRLGFQDVEGKPDWLLKRVGN